MASVGFEIGSVGEDRVCASESLGEDRTVLVVAGADGGTADGSREWTRVEYSFKARSLLSAPPSSHSP